MSEPELKATLDYAYGIELQLLFTNLVNDLAAPDDGPDTPALIWSRALRNLNVAYALALSTPAAPPDVPAGSSSSSVAPSPAGGLDQKMQEQIRQAAVAQARLSPVDAALQHVRWRNSFVVGNLSIDSPASREVYAQRVGARCRGRAAARYYQPSSEAIQC